MRSSLQTISEIHGSAFSIAAPDISESLRLLRQFIAFSDATTAPVAEPVEAIVADPQETSVVDPQKEPDAEPDQ